MFGCRGAVRGPALRHWCGGRVGTHRGNRSQTSSPSTPKTVGTRRTSTSSDPKYKLPSVCAQFSISQGKRRENSKRINEGDNKIKRRRQNRNGKSLVSRPRPFYCPLMVWSPKPNVIGLLFVFIGFKCYVKKKKKCLVLSYCDFNFPHCVH